MEQRARRFLTNFSFLIAGDLGAKLMVFWATVRMAHVLGNERFGDVAFAAAFSAYFLLLIGQGLGIYGTQELARNPAKVRELAGRVLALRLAASLLAIIGLVAAVWLLRRTPEFKLLLLCYGLIFFPTAMALNWVFQAFEQMRFVAAANFLTQLVFAACVLTFLGSATQFIWIPIFQFAGETAATLFLFYRYVRQFGRIRLEFRPHSWWGMLKESFPIGCSVALGMVLYNFDTVLLGFMKPPAEVGQYSAAYKYISFFSAFLSLYSTNLFPMVSRSRNDPAMLRRISDRSLRYTLALAIPLAIGGTLVARPLMEVVFGPQFSGGAAALRILIWVVPVVAGRTVYRSTMLSHGLQRGYLWIVLTAATVNTGLNLLLIPRYSYLGAASATLFCEVLVLALAYRVVARKVVRLELFQHLWKPLAACIPMTAFLLWNQGRHLFLLVSGGFAAYMIVAWAMRAIDPWDVWKAMRRPAP
jgi:O-antigen/teichoic acid export membrane protein